MNAHDCQDRRGGAGEDQERSRRGSGEEEEVEKRTMNMARVQSIAV